MGLSNMEKQIKDTLDERTIQPSVQAWDRLDAMLSLAEKEKPKSNYNWLFVAASFLGFVLIGTIFFSQTEEIVDVRKNEIVIGNDPIEKASEKESIHRADSPIPYNAKTNNALASSEITRTIRNNSEKGRDKEKVSGGEDLMSQNQVAENSKNSKNSKNDQIIGQQPIASISNDLPVTVDKISKKEIPNKKINIKVDAAGLLSQVDGELELTFRQKAIKTFTKNYKNAKDALASRNQDLQSY